MCPQPCSLHGKPWRRQRFTIQLKTTRLRMLPPQVMMNPQGRAPRDPPNVSTSQKRRRSSAVYRRQTTGKVHRVSSPPRPLRWLPFLRREWPAAPADHRRVPVANVIGVQDREAGRAQPAPSSISRPFNPTQLIRQRGGEGWSSSYASPASTPSLFRLGGSLTHAERRLRIPTNVMRSTRSFQKNKKSHTRIYIYINVNLQYFEAQQDGSLARSMTSARSSAFKSNTKNDPLVVGFQC